MIKPNLEHSAPIHTGDLIKDDTTTSSTLRIHSLFEISGYNIEYDARNIIVTPVGAPRFTSISFFTTLYGAIDFISGKLLKKKYNEQTIKDIDDIKKVIEEHNKFMKEICTFKFDELNKILGAVSYTHLPSPRDRS